MKLEEALYNWLSIKIVSDARPDDQAAADTHRFFREILEQDHGVDGLEVTVADDEYRVHYQIGGVESERCYPARTAQSLLRSIEAEPRYNDQ
ncbi:MAG TPA: hypothetical protein VFK44_14310 [Bacillales bacterium]|nr:hypothetical protein [Bacillales bacterium]